MFITSTGIVSTDLAFSLSQLPTLGPPNMEGLLTHVEICNNVMTRLNYLIADSIVIWRAWILWTNHSKVQMLLCICLIAIFVGVTVDLVFAILFKLSQFSDTSALPRKPSDDDGPDRLEVTNTEIIEMCEKLEFACLDKPDLACNLELAYNLRVFRTHARKEQFQNVQQTSIETFFVRKE
ncbi:hypothetical protein C8J56DRAFT_898387 [Mycena floridula]|nr:hypothetical protein C8J56DRAFT_898387 [Mycena floridula]